MSNLKNGTIIVSRIENVNTEVQFNITDSLPKVNVIDINFDDITTNPFGLDVKGDFLIKTNK